MVRTYALVIGGLLIACGGDDNNDDGGAEEGTESTVGNTMGTTMGDTLGTTVGMTAGTVGTSVGTTATTDGTTGMTGDTTDDLDTGSVTGSPAFDVEMKYGIPFIQYGRIMKTNDVPKLWIEAADIDAIVPGQPFPDGTRIIREEGDPEVGWIFIREKINGEWYQGDFFPDNWDFSTELEGSSCSCHINANDTTITYELLGRFRTTGILQEAGCNEGGNTPCPPGTYD